MGERGSGRMGDVASILGRRFGAVGCGGGRARLGAARARRLGAVGLLRSGCGGRGRWGFDGRELLVEKGFDEALGFGPQTVVAVVEFGEVQAGLSKKIFSRKGAKTRRCEEVADFRFQERQKAVMWVVK